MLAKDVKVVKVSEGHWNLLFKGNVVGRIEHISSWIGTSGRKFLYVKSKQICRVDNQKAAIEKLIEFFETNKEKIKEVETLIERLRIGITEVSHQVSKDALTGEIGRFELELINLKFYERVD